MIEMKVQQLLDEKKHTRYWLVKQMQSTYITVNKICNNTMVRIDLVTIEKLCQIFECTPNDLFEIK